jgi:hypothetical protein
VPLRWHLSCLLLSIFWPRRNPWNILVRMFEGLASCQAFRTPEREYWYINMGAVDKDFFTTDAMVKAAP